MISGITWNAEELPEAKEFADGSDDADNNRRTQARLQPIHEGGDRCDILCHPFGPAHHDAVGDDQPDKDAQHFGDAEKVGLQKLVDDDDKDRNDRKLCDHPHAVGGDFAQRGDEEGGEGRHKGYGEAHRHGDGKAVCHAQGGADAQDSHEDLVAAPKLICQVGHCWSYFLSHDPHDVFCCFDSLHAV